MNATCDNRHTSTVAKDYHVQSAANLNIENELAFLSHKYSNFGEGRNQSPLSRVVKVGWGTGFVCFLWARICPEKEPGTEACSQAPIHTSLLTHTPPAIGPPPVSWGSPSQLGVPGRKVCLRTQFPPGSHRGDAQLGAWRSHMCHTAAWEWSAKWCWVNLLPLWGKKSSWITPPTFHKGNFQVDLWDPLSVKVWRN